MANSTSTPLRRIDRRKPVDITGLQVRAQSRQLATVVAVSGAVDAVNAGPLSQYVRRFVLGDKPVILDLTAVARHDEQLPTLLSAIDDHCCALGIEWAVVLTGSVALDVRSVAARPLPIVETSAAAFRYFTEALHARRRLLPVLRKSA